MQSFSLRELASISESKLVGDPSHLIQGVNTLEEATCEEASFFANSRYEEALKKSKAGVICISAEAYPLISGKNLLISSNPSHAFQKIANAFFSKTKSAFSGISKKAVIHKSAKIEEGVTIAPNVVIDQEVTIKKGCFIAPFTYIGASVTIGEECIIHSNVTIREGCILGNRVILQPGVVIGSCGFGYTTTKEGKHIKLEQLGNVIIEDDVEIGANTTIDRARFKCTKIKKGSKIDNLVQIAHNVEIGEGNLIVAQSGVAGSAKTGKYVILGGQSGVAGHVEIGDLSMIASKAGVSKNLPPNGKFRGIPAIPINDYQRQEIYIRRLKKYSEIIDALQKKINHLEFILNDLKTAKKLN